MESVKNQIFKRQHASHSTNKHNKDEHLKEGRKEGRKMKIQKKKKEKKSCDPNVAVVL